MSLGTMIMVPDSVLGV